MSNHLNNISTIGSSEGKLLSIAGGNYRIIIPGSDTDGQYAVIEMTVPPGAGPNPHAHPDFTETFYVVEGEVTFNTADGNFHAEKGAFIKIPEGGQIHGFKNQSDRPAKLLCTVIPAGLDEFFCEVSQYLATNHPPDKDQIKAIFEKYGQTMYPENYFEAT